MRTLVIGGARSGKSAHAESLLGPGDPVRYVATLRPMDDESAARIARHRASRPQGWQTVEVDGDLTPAFADLMPGMTVLIEGLTLWLSAMLERQTDPAAEIRRAVERIAACPRIVVVTEEVGGGLVPEHPAARRYRDLAGELNQRVAAVCDRVVLVTAGLPLVLKSRETVQPPPAPPGVQVAGTTMGERLD